MSEVRKESDVIAERHAAAVRGVVGGVLQGFTVRDDRIELRFGRDRHLIIEAREALQAHYCPPPGGLR